MDIKFNIVCNDYIAIVTEKTVPFKSKSETLAQKYSSCSSAIGEASARSAIAWQFYFISQNPLSEGVSALKFSLPTKISPLLNKHQLETLEQQREVIRIAYRLGRGSTSQILGMESRRDRTIEQIVGVEIDKDESVRKLLQLVGK